MCDSLANAIWESVILSIPHHSPISHRSKRQNTCPMNQWFDANCKSFHRFVRSAFETHSPDFTLLRYSYLHFLRCKKRSFVSFQCRSLCSTLIRNPQIFCRTLFPQCSPLPSILDFYSLTSHTITLYDIPNQPSLHPTPPPYYHLFTPSNVYEAIRSMRCNRGADEEGFQAELFKLGALVLGSYLPTLFNRVVCTGFPSSWLRHVIYPIYKSRPISDPGNYRTIMIEHTFAKLYATALDTMLSSELDKRGCRERGQAGFRANYQTMDHIFTLRAIIEEARHQSKEVYCCFVDFRKAHDFVPEMALFQRISEIGISNMLLTTIMRL